ncbi:MAG: tRNA guanosine(34) transglycosylase Tgt [Chloroflexota bacterium]|nr:tRNA guanosine(34) transglycosylase Tgt [Chloroflexota bacterium]
MSFRFDLIATDNNSRARAGLIHTPHGSVSTPAFIPVGTQATVKALAPRNLHEIGASIVLANAYHLYLRPGSEIIAQLGGLHRFMGWDRPLLTDSGGFQVFSLAGLREVDDDGVTFRSHLDGSIHRLTPERAIAIQEQLGADIIMSLDECPEPDDRAYNEEALTRTHVWAARCREAQRRDDQALFGIIQGGIFPDLRRASAEYIAGLDFPGYAIGGLSVGESKQEMQAMLEATVPHLPEERPRHLLGVGAPDDLFECVARGIDSFDCVLPTRMARNGTVLTPTGRVNLGNARYVDDPAPIVEGCDCYTCQNFSRAYLHHLIKAKEILGLHLTTIHNLHFTLGLMRQMRDAILDGTFSRLKEEFLAGYKARNDLKL